MYTAPSEVSANMKKIIFLSIILLLLCGCTAKNVENTENDNVVHYISWLTNYYENGIIFGNDTTMFLDFETMEKTVLCSKPNCNHSGGDCIAKKMGDRIAVYDGYAYFFEASYGVDETTDGRKFRINSKLQKASLSTSEIGTVCTFTDRYPASSDGMILYNGDLYFIGNDLNPRYDEFGNITGSSDAGGIHSLCSIDLDSGKYTNYGSIYDGDKEYEAAKHSSSANICGYQDETFYIEYNFLTGEEADSGYDSFTSIIFAYDLTTKEMKQTDKIYPASANDTAYVYGIPQSTQTVIEINGEEKLITDYRATTNARVFNNKVFFDDCWYDLADMSSHSLGDYEYWYAVAYYDNCYILMNGSRNEKLTEDELFALDKK